MSWMTSSIDSIGMPAARVWALVNENSTSERHSSGCAAASSTATIVPSLRPITPAPSAPAAFSTATASPTCVCRSGSRASGIGSDSPVPRRSKWINRPNELSRRRNRAKSGKSHTAST
jgi:hypothetical protein